MTKWAILVIMTDWDYDSIKRMLDDFTGNENPTDPKVVKRLRIVHAATELFIKQGYRKTSISEVATQAGVAKGTVYLYYKNKPDLLMHAIAEEKQRIIGRLKPILEPDLAPKDRLKAWLRMVFVTVGDMPLTSKMLSGDPDILNVIYEYMDQHKEKHWRKFQQQFVMQLVGDALGETRLTETELTDRAKVFLGFAYFSLVVTDPRMRQGLSTERFADLVATMLVDGIGASTDPPERPNDKEVQ